jgi:hypothetical protein
MSRRFKDGGVPFCWHCGRQLVRIKGGFIHATLIDRIGNEMRVHKDCVKAAIGDGVKEKVSP